MVSATSLKLQQEAIDIAQLLHRQAIVAEDGSANWLSMNYHPETNQYQLDALGDDFYSGTTGIALFLAAVDKILGQESYRDFILDQALRPLQNEIHNSPLQSTLNEITQIGGAFGLGSLAYTLIKTGQMMNEASLIEAAVKIGLLITPKRIEHDNHLDLLLGTGGALLSLLAVYEAANDERLLNRAILCGEYLLNQRVVSETGHRAWVTITKGQMLTGFAHGVAGIAYALLRLYEVTRDERFLAAGAEGIAYEHSAFSPQHNNWPDWRHGDSPKFNGIGWCSGAPGIGLGRLAGLHILDTVDIREDIERALNITAEANFLYSDHLCCGNLGRAEILLEMANWSGDARLLQTAYDRVTQIIERKRAKGEFNVSPFFSAAYQPGFFKGLAGIGYALLRIEHPQSLPLVLAWQ